MGNKNSLHWVFRVFVFFCAAYFCFPSLAYAQTETPTVDFNCNSSGFQVEIAPALPNRLPGFALNQSGANCMAWQTFISLNWAADPKNPGQPDTSVPASQFGVPTTPITPVVWESYREASEVVGANLAQNWRSPQALPDRFRQFSNTKNLAPTSRFGFKALTATSKFTDGPEFVINNIAEAFTNSWLTAQNQSLTFYEIRLNQDEYRYITENTLAIPKFQQACANGQVGLNLPSGSANNNQDQNCQGTNTNYGTDGAIEIKAAWIELKDASLYPRYKIAQAIIQGPNDPQPRSATMGLVGLHIIHKVPNAQQLVWATFEHIDNAPSIIDVQNNQLKSSYTFYNPNCNSITDTYHCEQNHQPQPENKDPYDAPVQVVRLTSIPSYSANLNQAVWSTLKNVNPSSVFQYYQLIDTMWPKSSQTIGSGATTPLASGNIQSGSNSYVANTTLETYFQQPSQQPNSPSLFTPAGCLGCHVLAQIASSSMVGNKARIVLPSSLELQTNPNTNAPLASDYSFVFSQAKAASKLLKSSSP